MSLPRIVCPYNKRLLASISGQSVAVRVDSCDKVAEAVHEVQSGNELFCVIVETDLALESILLPDELKDVPLAVMAKSMGKFRNLAKLNAWQEFNLRVYLSCSSTANITALKILSSIGVHTCAVFGAGTDDWDALTDLMTYAVLGQVPHASMQPFSFIAANYQPDSHVDWGAAYFDDPTRYIHLDDEGRVAFSRAELERGEFVAQSLAELGPLSDCPARTNRKLARKSYFLENHPCSFCPGWKVCLGRFSGLNSGRAGCAQFFSEMVDVARQYKRLNAPPQDKLWQP